MDQAFHMLHHLICRLFLGNGYYYSHFHVKKASLKRASKCPNSKSSGFEPQLSSFCSFLFFTFLLYLEGRNKSQVISSLFLLVNQRKGLEVRLLKYNLLLTFELCKCFGFFLKTKISKENRANPKIGNKLKLITLTLYQIGYITIQRK